MDEPTSVLTPQETEQLFTVLRRFRDNGMAVLFISHKLDEIRALTSRATVLRRGQNVGSVDTKSKSSRQLAEMMVGTKVQNVTRQKASIKGKVIFTVDGLNRPKHSQFATALRDISIAAKSGEILGIAGIAGNGQDELMASLMGEWCPRERNIIKIDGKDVSQLDPAQRRLAGLGFVPEERNGHAAVTSMTLSENALLTAHSLEGAINSNMIDFSFLQRRAAQIIGSFDVRTPEDDPMASSLSGGNLQKFVVGREIIKAPQVLIVSQPTWGVDVGAAVFIRKAMLDLAAAGSAVIMLSQDLEEIFAISHKISVLHEGRLSAATDTGDMTAEGVGLLMGGLQQDSDAASPKPKSAAKKAAPKKSARRSAS
jgi:simple sugar transport system ATP-binding protein